MRRAAGFLWTVASLLGVTSCASIPKTAQTVVAPPADTDGVLGLIGRATISHGCPVGPEEMLTAGHVFDPRPMDPVPLIGATYATPSGDTGAIVPTGREMAWDIAYGVPLEPFKRWYPVAVEPPKPGEKLWLNAWDFASQETAFSEPTLEITVSRLVAGYIIARESIPQGTSGGCVINAKNETVAIVSFGKYVGQPSSQREVSGIVSVWGPWLGRMKAYAAKLKALEKESEEKRKREQIEALIGAIQ